jgi:hypothetical protein
MNDQIETLLRKHDPAAGQVLTPFDRARILRSAVVSQGSARQMKVIIAFATTLLLIIVSAFVLRSHHRDESPRQVQYATPGGTRIVWTLDPKFRM